MRSKSLRWKGLKIAVVSGLLWLPLAGFGAEPAVAPRVVASIKPLHSLVVSVMQGISEPALLVPGGASPHDYNLRPSDARTLEQAQVIFWTGPELENFLIKPLHNIKGQVRAVALLDAPGIMVLPLREGGAWERHRHPHRPPPAHGEPGHNHERDHLADHAAHGEPDRGHAADRDAHIWLDPVNASAIVRQMVATLSEVDPAHQADYARNGAALTERLEQMNQQLAAELAPVLDQPYIVFHDAYQYFERRYGLNGVGSVVLSPDQRPGARRVAEIQARIRELKVRCVFSEPQFQPALVETVIEGSQARRGVLDPEGGAELPSGPEAYFQLLQKLSGSLRTCLSGS